MNMKKLIIPLTALLLASSLAGCGGETPPAETKSDTLPSTVEDTLPESETAASATETDTETEPVTETESPYAPIDPATLTAEKTYDNDHGSVLSTYPEKTEEDYEGVCVHYERAGYTLYSETEQNGNRFSTYTKDAEMAHVYWMEADRELNIVRSATNGAHLPPKDGGEVGTNVSSVTQLQQLPGQTSGMAYVVELSDGSFLIYDGGYADTVDQLLTELHTRNGDGEVHIRAWFITHSHDDHFSGFQSLARRMKMYLADYPITIKLDYLIVSPLATEDALSMDEDGKFFAESMETCVAKFAGAQICYAHTGMQFRFSDLTVDVLYTGDDLFTDGSTGYFNESSMVTRLSSHRPETGQTLSMLFLGDAGASVAERLERYYGETLRADLCQISHHGVENFPLSTYELIAAPTLFYPCNRYLYALTDRDADVRAALRESTVTQEILIRENDKYTRYLDPSKNPAPVGKPDANGQMPTSP